MVLNDNPFCNEFAAEHEIDDQTVVIYPEVVSGNPLNSQHVVRWMLCDLGVHIPFSIYHTWDPNDLIFHYSTFNAKYNPEDVHILTTTWIDPKIKDTQQPKEGSCYLLKKGSLFHNYLQFIHPKDALLLDPLSHEKIILTLQQKKYFYSYDPYSYYDVIALLCGCIPIIYPLSGIDKKQWLKTRAPFQSLMKTQNDIAGIAYGIQDLPHAEATLPYAKQEFMHLKKMEQTTVQQLIHFSKTHFFNKSPVPNTLHQTATRLRWDLLSSDPEQHNRTLERSLQHKTQKYKPYPKLQKLWQWLKKSMRSRTPS